MLARKPKRLFYAMLVQDMDRYVKVLQDYLNSSDERFFMKGHHMLLRIVVFAMLLFILGCQTTTPIKEEDPNYPIQTGFSSESTTTPEITPNIVVTPASVTPTAPAESFVAPQQLQPITVVVQNMQPPKEEIPPPISPTIMEPVHPVEPTPAIVLPEPPPVADPTSIVDAGRPEDSNEPEPKSNDAKYYHVRMVSLPHDDLCRLYAKDLEKFLKKQKVEHIEIREVERKKDGKWFWVVDVGKFESSKDDVAKEFYRKVKELRYKNKNFHDAFFVQY